MAKRGGSQWGIAGLNGVVAVVLLMLVGFLALVVNPPSPPGIAAFAPQAEKQITKAPLSQSSQSGEGDGACAAGQICDELGRATTTTIKGKARGVPSALQCYKWPDGSVTQTFDPQSPPCVATWDDSKGNGGATSRGVTGTEIRVAFPVNTTDPTDGRLKPIVDFFNTRYQFYGRKIRIVPFGSQQADGNFGTAFNSPERQRADAAQITQLNVFASLDFIDPAHYSWSLPEFRDVLTRNKIISVAGGEMAPYGTEAGFAANAPYEWTYYPTIDSVLKTYADTTCRQLVGKPARHASDAALRTKTRKFALMFPTDANMGGGVPGLDALVQRLAGCGVSSPRVVRYELGPDSSAPNAATMSDLSRSGVTTLLWFPTSGSQQPAHPMNAAAAVNFGPEWWTVGWNNYLTASTLNANEESTRASFGIGIWNKQPPLEFNYWFKAYYAAGGDPAVQSASIPDALAFYNEMLLIAAGVQMAGPNLTPQSFAAGLRATKFSNPGAGAAPMYQATVGFGPNDTTMVKDFQSFWLDIRMRGQDVTAANSMNVDRAYCYVGLGRRFSSVIPTTDGYYQPNVCR